jgi:urease beta subunit
MATRTASSPAIQKQFEQAGFTVTVAQPGTLEVRKSDCAAYVKNQGDRGIYLGPPYFVSHGVNCELEDAGYQKFWLSKADGKRFPIRETDLLTLHRFDEEVRYILGLKSLYNDSLGTTNARTVYDRLAGRPDR